MSQTDALAAPARATGTVTLLFSDMEGSTRLLESLGADYAQLLETHNEIVRRAFAENGGREIDNAGDGFFAAFARARDAVAASVRMQSEIAHAAWPRGVRVRVRVGLHTGEPMRGSSGYVGIDVHRAARISGAATGGQVLLSAATRHLVATDLPRGVTVRELGRHRLRDLREPEHLFQLVIDGLDSDFPAIGGVETRLRNFARPGNPLIGRDREVGEIRTLLLRDDVRAVTLTGPGGSGKTRLALAVAISSADAFEGGAWFVPLATVRDAGLVGPTIARALDISEKPASTPLACLTEALVDRQILLVLDNFEQVSDAAPLVADLLAACPRLEVLVTSRGVLRITSEYAYPVAPLALPRGRAIRHPASIRSYPAVALFLERARAVRPDFELTIENAPAVVEICARLDGLPLALELAAARVKLFSPQALLARLERRLDILKGGARDLPERHQTLRQTIAWSHDLLAATEQALFRRMSIFVSSATIEAVEAVCVEPGEAGTEVLDGIASLVDRGLLRREEGAHAETRLVMLETIREFGLEKLEQAGEVDVARRAHAAHFLALAEQAAPWLRREEAPVWLDRLAADHDNLHAALQWAADAGDAGVALRLATALVRFWIIRGHLREGSVWLRRILDLPAASEPTAARAMALNALGTITHELSDYREAKRRLRECLEIWRALGDERGTAGATAGLGWIDNMLGDIAQSESLSAEALAIYQRLDDVPGQALALHQLGWIDIAAGRIADAVRRFEYVLAVRQQLGDRRGVAFTETNLAYALTLAGEFDRAAAFFDEALATVNLLRDTQLIAWNLSRQGVLAWSRGDHDVAANLLDESLPLWRDVGNKYGIARTLTELGVVEAERGDFDRAALLIDEAERIWQTTGSTLGSVAIAQARAMRSVCMRSPGAATDVISCMAAPDIAGNGIAIAESLEMLATIALERDQLDTATLLLGLADTLRDGGGAPIPPRWRARYDAIIATCRAGLGAGFSATMDRGRSLTLDDAIAIARERLATWWHAARSAVK